jgi:hypothetical protein
MIGDYTHETYSARFDMLQIQGEKLALSEFEALQKEQEALQEEFDAAMEVITQLLYPTPEKG